MAGIGKQQAGIPSWVKLWMWIGAAGAIVLLIMIVAGHGPWQHMGGTH